MYQLTPRKLRQIYEDHRDAHLTIEGSVVLITWSEHDGWGGEKPCCLEYRIASPKKLASYCGWHKLSYHHYET
jgi:hypothetical protein